MKKNKKYSNIDFRVMSFFFKIRDKRYPPIEKVRKANIKQGDVILDYGCGPGSYTLAAVKEVGPNGKVIAVDIHPLALKKIKKRMGKMGYINFETIQTDCATELNDESVDKIICFDVLHGVPNKNEILNEFHRVLKSNAMLSFDDHHMNETEIIAFITSKGRFKLIEKKDRQYNFIKV
jgi:ubiquinone/menaquinone biosynthesis C-methylase UbiE